MRMARIIKFQTSKNRLLTFALLYVAMFLVNNGSFAELMKSTGVTILDTQFAYSPTEAYSTLFNLGAAGRLTYRNLLIIDCIFPLTYAAFLCSLIGFLLKKYVKYNGKWDLLIYLPIAAMVFDWLENAAIFGMLHAFPKERVWLEMFAGFSTTVKLLCSVLSVAIAIGIVIYGKTKGRVKNNP